MTMGPGACLRVELYGEGPEAGIVHALAGAVVGVGEGNLSGGEAGGVHGIAVVLAGDVGADAVQIPHRLVDAPVAVFQFEGGASGGQRGELVPQADAKEGGLAQKLLDLGDLVDVFRRVAGAVGEHYAVRVCGQDLFRGGRRRQDGDGAAPLLQFPDNVLLGAVVQKGDPEPLFPFSGAEDGLPAGDGLHHAGHGVGGHCREIGGDFVADAGVHDAGLPENPGQFPGIHAAEARHAPLLQERVQIPLAAEVGGFLAPLPHHVAPHMTFALEVFGDHAIVADERIGLGNNLSRVAGIRQGFQVAAHAGSEYQFAGCVRLRAKARALKHPAVL